MTNEPNQTNQTNWTSTADPRSIAAWLSGRRSVAVLTHIKPDGDAIGSSLAAARALNIAAGGSAAGFSGVAAKAEVWYAGPLPHWAGAFIRDTPQRHIAHDGIGAPAVPPDAFLVVDTGSWSQLADYKPHLQGKADRTALIDHHLRGDPDVAQRRIVEPNASAACELVAGLCVALLGLQDPRALPLDVAEPLYLGIATDTGWFRHANVTPSVLRLAADLLDAGVNHEHLHAVVEERERPSRLRLLARALTSLRLEREGEVALLTLTPTDFEAARAGPGESGGFLDLVRAVESVRVAVLLTQTHEHGDTITKVSLRSKGGPGMIDVNAVATRLGGGGHAQAAGARLPGSIAEVERLLMAAIAAEADQ